MSHITPATAYTVSIQFMLMMITNLYTQKNLSWCHISPLLPARLFLETSGKTYTPSLPLLPCHLSFLPWGRLTWLPLPSPHPALTKGPNDPSPLRRIWFYPNFTWFFSLFLGQHSLRFFLNLRSQSVCFDLCLSTRHYNVESEREGPREEATGGRPGEREVPEARSDTTVPSCSSPGDSPYSATSMSHRVIRSIPARSLKYGHFHPALPQLT